MWHIVAPYGGKTANQPARPTTYPGKPAFSSMKQKGRYPIEGYRPLKKKNYFVSTESGVEPEEIDNMTTTLFLPGKCGGLSQ
jgi:hypothetical protein